MPVRKSVLAAALCAAALTPAVSQAWTKTFVVEYFEPAMLYGGPENGGGATLGTDCPNGINDMDWSKQLVTPYRTPAEVQAINNAEYGRDRFLAHLGFRGKNRESIYENPTAIDDPGLILSASPVAEGFDLDGNPNTGFLGLNGERGIDNAFYKVGGCMLYFRGPPRSAPGFKIQNDYMQDGAYAMVLTFSGDQDPMNDDDVTVSLHTSPDKMVKDANGAIAWDYTFRSDPDPRWTTRFKAQVRDGVVTNTAPIVFRSHDLERRGIKRPIVLHDAKVRFEFAEDGTAYGLVGGYRDIWDHFRLILGNGRATGGAIRENLGHFDASGWYYAMRRHADGLRDPATGVNHGISTTYRYYLVPAIVLPPQEGGVIPASTAPRPAPQQDTEAARLESAGFAPIGKVASEGRTLRRVTYRNPFGAQNAPSVSIEALANGEAEFVVTAYNGQVRETGRLSAAAWSELTALDTALAPPGASRVNVKAELCHAKQIVIEAAESGKARRREASICGGPADTAAVLYGYKVADLVLTQMPRCKGFIESGREPSWVLAECLRDPSEHEDRDNQYERILGRN